MSRPQKRHAIPAIGIVRGKRECGVSGASAREPKARPAEMRTESDERPKHAARLTMFPICSLLFSPPRLGRVWTFDRDAPAMSIESHVFFRGALPSKAALTRAMKELGFPF